MPKKIVREIMPAHHSDRITVEQAKEVFLRLRAEAEERASRRRKRRSTPAGEPADTPEP